jgi:glycosyltransferase involved in cell wall biosynthesis
MKYPLVSILIPLYNSEKYIAETLISAINLSWPKKEIIVVDDGSTDKSYEIAKRYESEILKVYRQDNKGACLARNKAFELSTGDYIQYLDADDLLSPNKIEEQMKLFKEYGDDIITSCSWTRFHTSVDNLKIKKQKIDKDYPNPVDWLIDSWNGGGMAAQHCWLIPRIIILKAGNWNIKLRKNQDGEFLSRILIHSRSIKYCSNTIVYYRNSPGSVSNTYNFDVVSSILDSYIIYEQNLIDYIKSNINLRESLAKLYSNLFAYIYPSYPVLLKKTEERVKQLGFNSLPISGGKNFQLLARTVGFKTALLLRHKFYKYISFRK